VNSEHILADSNYRTIDVSADLAEAIPFRCIDNIHVCKLIALCTANAYSTEREVSASACTRSMAG